jgi:hypothetical protein
VQVLTCLVDAYGDYSCFSEVCLIIVSTISKWNKAAAIKFCVKLMNRATEAFEMLKNAYSDECVSWTSVFEWHKRLEEGHG